MRLNRLKSSLILRWIFPAFFIAFAAWMAIASTGFLEADELTHFLLGRQMATSWREVLSIWGRPACTGLYGLATILGGGESPIAARLLAVIVTAATAIGTVKLWQVVRGYSTPVTSEEPRFQIFRNGYVFWLWILFFAQPMVLLNSFTVMTEMLLACTWVWAMVFLGRNRSHWASLLIGVGVLTRPEGMVAVVIWGGVLLLWRWATRASENQKRITLWTIITGMAISIIPLTLWWAAGALAYSDIGWMIQKFPWHVVSQYGKTGVLFLEASLVALAVWMWLPVAIGTWVLRKNKPALLLLIAPLAGFFLLHGVLGTFGLFGSMSLPRYFICVAPFAAVTALIGLEVMEARIWWPRFLRRAVMLLCILPAVLLVVMGQLPEPKSTDLEKMDLAINEFKRQCLVRNIAKPEWGDWLIAGHPYVFYRTELAMDSPAHIKMFSRDAIHYARPGTMLITDAILWGWEGEPGPDELRSWGYQPDLLVAAEVSAILPRFDLSAIGSKAGGEVGMWIKVR